MESRRNYATVHNITRLRLQIIAHGIAMRLIPLHA
jgi:hypothetical protein